jgi:hypothetical protein
MLEERLRDQVFTLVTIGYDEPQAQLICTFWYTVLFRA